MAFIKYRDGFNGVYEIGGQTLTIGRDAIQPYDMTYGAIASCLYATMLSVAEETGKKIENADFDVTGEKRTTVPTTVEKLKIRAVVYSDESEEDIVSCFEAALKRCSMVQTFVKVATLDYKVTKG